jgi:hypothetical protein
MSLNESTVEETVPQWIWELGYPVGLRLHSYNSRTRGTLVPMPSDG